MDLTDGKEIFPHFHSETLSSFSKYVTGLEGLDTQSHQVIPVTAVNGILGLQKKKKGFISDIIKQC